MDASGGQQMSSHPGLAELLGRALTDEKFREALYQEREHAVQGYILSNADWEALQSVPRDVLDQHAQQFAAGTASAMTIGISIKGTF